MILFGASGHAKVVIDILEKLDIKVEFLVDANPDILKLQSYVVKNELDYKPDVSDQVIITIGSNRIRKEIAARINVEFGWGIHPTAILGDDISIDKGSVIMAGAIINSSTSIGSHTIINTSCSIDHDCEISDFVHVSPNTTLCGSIRVGEGAHIGAGATIIPNLSIGKWATIGAGSVVIADVPDYAVVVGNPGRIIKYNDPKR